MPPIEHIDKIARELQRGVLFIAFSRDLFRSYEYKNNKERNDLIQWLNDREIAYTRCASIASERTMESYRGQLYIDLPFDVNNEKFQELDEHLCNADNTPKIPGVLFYYLSLDAAMENAHHDEPGFWDKWAETF